MVDLLDYWCYLPSSIDLVDPARNFNFAVKRGKWTAKAVLFQGLVERSHEVSLDEESSEDELAHRVSERQKVMERFHEPSAEEIALRHRTLETARQFLACLPQHELRKWLGPFIDGEHVADVAARNGQTRQAVDNQRRRGLERIVEAAKKAGLHE